MLVGVQNAKQARTFDTLDLDEHFAFLLFFFHKTPIGFWGNSRCRAIMQPMCDSKIAMSCMESLSELAGECVGRTCQNGLNVIGRCRRPSYIKPHAPSDMAFELDLRSKGQNGSLCWYCHSQRSELQAAHRSFHQQRNCTRNWGPDHHFARPRVCQDRN